MVVGCFCLSAPRPHARTHRQERERARESCREGGARGPSWWAAGDKRRAVPRRTPREGDTQVVAPLPRHTRGTPRHGHSEAQGCAVLCGAVVWCRVLGDFGEGRTTRARVGCWRKCVGGQRAVARPGSAAHAHTHKEGRSGGAGGGGVGGVVVVVVVCVRGGKGGKGEEKRGRQRAASVLSLPLIGRGERTSSTSGGLACGYVCKGRGGWGKGWGRWWGGTQVPHHTEKADMTRKGSRVLLCVKGARG